MGWESLAFRCRQCKNVEEVVIDRTERDIPRPCPVCGGEAIRMLWANITRASYIDGTKRWTGVQEARKLERELRKLKQKRAAGNLSHEQTETLLGEMQRIKTEQKEVKRKSKKLVETAPKVGPEK